MPMAPARRLGWNSSPLRRRPGIHHSLLEPALVDCSQDTVPITVFRRRSDSLFQTGFMYSMLDALELCNSPASMRKGLPSTIICVTAPFFLRAGSGAALGAALRSEEHTS